MALPKAVVYMVALLVMYYSLEKQGHRLNVFSQDLIGTKSSHIHARQKRETSSNSSDYVLQAVINTSDLERLRTLLSTFSGHSFSLMNNGTAEITSIDTTTVCSSNMSGYECRCEQSFAWSFNSCITYGACDAIVGDTCGCIGALPADYQFCQLNISRIASTTPTPTPPNDLVDIDVVLDLRFPAFSLPLNFSDILRETLNNIPLPQPISQTLNVTSLNFTTGCFPNSTGGLQCQCEEHFAWSCDKCDIYGACSNATRQTCRCINGLPSDGEFCEPISNVTQCPTPTPVTMTTTMTTPMTTTSMTTTPMTTTPMTTTSMTTTPMTTTPMTTTSMTTTPMTTTPMTTTSMTTTPMTTTPMTTTTQMATTTATQMATTTMPVPTTTPIMTTTPMQMRNLSFVMDIEFDSSYNDPTNQVYKDANDSISTQSEEHISTLKTVELIGFRSGSTIGDYTVTATSFEEAEIEALTAGIFIQLSQIYPMIYDSQKSLQFEPPFFVENVTVTCGPPPENLNFGTNLRAEWRRNNEPILEDGEHSFLTENGQATLTVSNFFSIENEQFECRLTIDNRIFRQISNGPVMLQTRPFIQVTPVTTRINCDVTREVRLQCSVNSPYEVKFKEIPDAGTGGTISHLYSINNCENRTERFTCQVNNYEDSTREITLVLSTESFLCENDDVFGNGNVGDRAAVPCGSNEVGDRTAICQENGEWGDRQDNCVLQPIQELLDQSEFLNEDSLVEFVDLLRNVTLNFTEQVVESPANINAIVQILDNVANTSLLITITNTSMEDILITVGVLTTDEARDSWLFLNTNDTRDTSVTRTTSPTVDSVSSRLLQSLETITSRLTTDSFDIDTPLILLNKTTFTDTFNAVFNSSVEINIPESDEGENSITVITFASMDNVLPARDRANSSIQVINGRVVLVQSSSTINNVSFTFDIINDTLTNPQCVFWNFSLFDGLGGWDDSGCQLVQVNETVTCNCNHLTSFSILMSPYSPDDPVLDYITYIGVSISMASLVICLIIEAVIWRKIRRNTTSYLRHVSIVNIAVSLLIANIWFIIGAAISEENGDNPPACSAATFFIHFFYLALFFWMLASALLLLYRTVSVFDGGLSKTSMLVIGFTLGYGAPLIIAVITIAVTAPRQQYIRERGICWLNWEQSKALLAFVIPALLIVVINLFILLVVIYKMLRRRAVGDAAQAAERHVLVVIVRSLAVLTPFFGLTWSLGVGTLFAPRNRGIHISFAFFNSLQGFFILVFGTLLDKKVRSEIAIKSQTTASGTRSTSTGNSSSSGLGFLRNWRRGRDGYNISSSASGETQSFSNT